MLSRTIGLSLRVRRPLSRLNKPVPAPSFQHYQRAGSTSTLQDPGRSRVEGAEAIIGYKFKDRDKYVEALNIPGKEQDLRWTKNCHRSLALIGRSALGLALSEQWAVSEFTKEHWQPLVDAQNQKRLYEIGRKFGFGDVIQRVPLEIPHRGIHIREMARVVEAIIGAVYLDGGMDAVKLVSRTLQLYEPLGIKRGGCRE